MSDVISIDDGIKAIPPRMSWRKDVELKSALYNLNAGESVLVESAKRHRLTWAVRMARKFNPSAQYAIRSVGSEGNRFRIHRLEDVDNA